jgi:hypothetical protein
MSADSTAYDPYRTPDLPSAQAGAAPGGRPGWLTALCVMCIVIGVLGLMNGIVGFFGTLFAEHFQQMFTPTGASGLPPEMKEVQDQFQAESLAVQAKFFAFSLSAAVLRVAVAAALLVGGTQCLGLKETGRQVLMLACGAAIVFEIGHAVLQSLVNMEMMTAVNGFLERFLQTMPQRNGPPPEFFINIMKGWLIAVFVMQYLIGLAKIAFYLWCVVFLQRQAIRALFGKPAAEPLAAYS